MFSIYSILVVQICTSAIYHNTDAYEFLREAWHQYDKDENINTSPSLKFRWWWLHGNGHENEDEVPLHELENKYFSESPLTLGDFRHENEDDVPLQEKENEDFKGSYISLRRWIGGSRHVPEDEVPLQEKENEAIEQRPISLRDLIGDSMYENEDEVPFPQENGYFKESPSPFRDFINDFRHENEDYMPLQEKENEDEEGSRISLRDLIGDSMHENEDEVPLQEKENEDEEGSPMSSSGLFGGTWHENGHEESPEKAKKEKFEKELCTMLNFLDKHFRWNPVEESTTRQDSEEFPDTNFGDGETTHDNKIINTRRESDFEHISKLCKLFLDGIIPGIEELQTKYEQRYIDIMYGKPSIDNEGDHFSSEDGGILTLIPGTMHETSLKSTTESTAEDVEIEKHSTEEKENPKEPEIVESSFESTTEYSTEYEEKENHPKDENEYTEEPEIVGSSFESTSEPSTEYVDIEIHPKEEKEYPEIVEIQEINNHEFHNFIPNYGMIDRYSYKTKGDGNYLSESQVHIYPKYINSISGSYKLGEEKLDKVKREAPITNGHEGFLADQPIAVEEHVEKKKAGNVEFGRGNSDRSQLIGKFLTELDKETGGGQTKYNVGPSFSHPVTTTEKSFWKKIFDLL